MHRKIFPEFDPPAPRIIGFPRPFALNPRKHTELARHLRLICPVARQTPKN
ncbi:MAG: hypothetical protein GTO41_17075 [Burkholderiales bacterium]|nr:hypothetical protein [Burkholderiales bacterium]